jgi:Protein of unknown function (DUF998)
LVVGQEWLLDDPRSAARFVSQLSLGPFGLVQNLNFVIFGLLLIWLSRGLKQEFGTDRAAPKGPILVAVVGVNSIVAGLFNADSQPTVHGVVHLIDAVAAFVVFMPASVIAFFGRFRIDARWRWFLPWTYVCGVLLALSGLFMLLPVVFGRIYPPFIIDNGGAIQRAYLLIYFAWLIALSAGLLTSRRWPLQ